jgi:hypothetical protein
MPKHSGVRRSHDPVASFGLGHLDGCRKYRSLYRLDQLGIAATRTARDPLLKVLDHRRELSSLRTSAMAFSPCLEKSLSNAQITASVSLLREPRSRPAGLPSSCH